MLEEWQLCEYQKTVRERGREKKECSHQYRIHRCESRDASHKCSQLLN